MPNLHDKKIKFLEEMANAHDGKSAQDIQDAIFQKMSADQKVALGAKLWLLGKELDAKKIDYARNNRSTPFARKSSASSG